MMTVTTAMKMLMVKLIAMLILMKISATKYFVFTMLIFSPQDCMNLYTLYCHTRCVFLIHILMLDSTDLLLRHRKNIALTY